MLEKCDASCSERDCGEVIWVTARSARQQIERQNLMKKAKRKKWGKTLVLLREPGSRPGKPEKSSFCIEKTNLNCHDSLCQGFGDS